LGGTKGPPFWHYYSSMRLKIKRLDSSIGLPEPATGGAAGFDLAAAVDMDIPARSIRLVGTGLVIGVPDGYFLGIFARSSTPLKRGLMVANGVGIIDADYCGPADEIKIQLLNVTDEPVKVTRGDRLAQGIVLPCPRVEWQEVQEMAAPTRGGFGSTGN
jgi:dUTP pyrophosphatase